jgi:hypothetical protein
VRDWVERRCTCPREVQAGVGGEYCRERKRRYVDGSTWGEEQNLC